MVTEHMDYDNSSLDAPRTAEREHHIRLRPPRAGRSRSQTRKAGSSHGGIRQRRNKRWSW